MTENLPARRTVGLDDVHTLDEAMELCNVIAQTDLVPKALQGRSANILLVFMMGREIGLSLAQSVREIYCPPGGQPQMRGRLLLARLRQAGHDYWWEDGEDSDGVFCHFTVKRGDNGREYESRFSIADALAAGLVAKRDGQIVALSREGRPLPWMTYRSDMLFWRAVARAVNRAAPEVAMGFDVMEAAPPAQDGPPATPGGPVPAAAQAGTPGPAPNPPAEPGPTDVAAELAQLDERGQAWQPAEYERVASETVNADAQPATREERQQLTDAFAGLGWNPRKHKQTILEACTAFCGRPVLASSDLTSREVHDMIADMGTVKGTDEALPVLLADRVEAWRERLRESDPETAAALFG